MSAIPLQPQLDAEAFRRKVAGLAGSEDATQYETSEFRAAAIDLCLILCRLYGEDLDRLRMWDRISTGLATTCSRVPSGEGEAFLSNALEHVRADAGAASREPAVSTWLRSYCTQPPAWQRQFVAYLGTRLYAILVHARDAWELKKEEARNAR